MKNLFKKNLSYILCAMLFAAMTLNAGCGKKAEPVTSADTNIYGETVVSTEVSVSEDTEVSVSEEANTSEDVKVNDETNVSEEVANDNNGVESADYGIETREGCELGEGDSQFTFIVADADGNETTFTVNSNAKTVGEALVDVNLIAGEESSFGLYVKCVNGIVADYDVDKSYWAFYIDGEYAQTGVDSTELVSGSTYSFKVEK